MENSHFLLSSPHPETIALGSSATFSWDSDGLDINSWWLYAGSTPGANDFLDSRLLTESQLELTVSGWQAGDYVHVRFWYRYATGPWLYLDRRDLTGL